jgi:hypothetical protein
VNATRRFIAAARASHGTQGENPIFVVTRLIASPSPTSLVISNGTGIVTGVFVCFGRRILIHLSNIVPLLKAIT